MDRVQRSIPSTIARPSREIRGGGGRGGPASLPPGGGAYERAAAGAWDDRHGTRALLAHTHTPPLSRPPRLCGTQVAFLPFLAEEVVVVGPARIARRRQLFDRHPAQPRVAVPELR